MVCRFFANDLCRPIRGASFALVASALGLIFVACEEDDFKVAEPGGDAGAESIAGAGGQAHTGGAGTGGGDTGGGDTGGNDAGGGEAGAGGHDTGGTSTGGASNLGGADNTGGGTASSVLIDENFSADSGSWTFIDPEVPLGTTEAAAKSEWTYERAGFLSQLTNYAGCITGSAPACSAATTEPSLAISLAAGSESWTDYTLIASLIALDNDPVGVVARYQDEDNYLLFEAAVEGNYVRLRAIQNGVWKTLIEDLTPEANYVQSIDSAVPNELRLTVFGANYAAFVNGVKVLTVTDGTGGTPRKGGVGLASLQSVDVRFDSVKVVAE